MSWQKHTYICTECDTQMEFTSYLPESDLKVICPCEHQAIMKMSTYSLVKWGEYVTGEAK